MYVETNDGTIHVPNYSRHIQFRSIKPRETVFLNEYTLPPIEIQSRIASISTFDIIGGPLNSRMFRRINFVCLHPQFPGWVTMNDEIKSFEEFEVYIEEMTRKYLPRLLVGCPCLNYLEQNYFSRELTILL